MVCFSGIHNNRDDKQQHNSKSRTYITGKRFLKEMDKLNIEKNQGIKAGQL